MRRSFYLFILCFTCFTFISAAPVPPKGIAFIAHAITKFSRPLLHRKAHNLVHNEPHDRVSAAPVDPEADPSTAPLHRTGTKNSAMGGAIRKVDWNIDNGHVQPHPTKGLSLSTIPPINLDKDQFIHSINPARLEGTGFKPVHDGISAENPTSTQPPGHVTLVYHSGPPVPITKGVDDTHMTFREKIDKLPWTRIPKARKK